MRFVFSEPGHTFKYFHHHLITMPQFIPILLLAVATLAALYLGFSFISAPHTSSTGFAFAQPQSEKSPQSIIPYFAQPNRGDEIILGNNFEIGISNNLEIAELAGSVDSKSAETASAFQDFSKPENADRVQAVLKIKSTNSGGEISVFVNRQEVYRGAPSVGKYIFELDTSMLEDENNIRVDARSGWIFSHASYDFNLKLYSLDGSHAKYKFYIKDKDSRKLEMSFSKNEGWLKILLNGKEVFYGKPKEFFSVDLKSEFFSSDENSDFKSTEKNSLG